MNYCECENPWSGEVMPEFCMRCLKQIFKLGTVHNDNIS